MTVHCESEGDTAEQLRQIRGLGAAAGVALNPDTPLSSVESYLELCDLVLVMSVNAGFGGQSFKPIALEKLTQLRTLVQDNGKVLEVDGGVNANTIADCTAAGADLLVVGSAIFREDDYTTALIKLNELANEGGNRR